MGLIMSKEKFYSASSSSCVISSKRPNEERLSNQYDDFFADVNAAYDAHSKTLIASLLAAQKGERLTPESVDIMPTTTTTATTIAEQKPIEAAKMNPAQIKDAKNAARYEFEQAMFEVIDDGVQAIVAKIPMFTDLPGTLGEYMQKNNVLSIVAFATPAANPTLKIQHMAQIAELLKESECISDECKKDPKAFNNYLAMFDKDMDRYSTNAGKVKERVALLKDEVKKVSEGIQIQLERDAKPQTTSFFTLRKGFFLCVLAAAQTLAMFRTESTDKLRLMSYAFTSTGTSLLAVQYLFRSAVKVFDNADFKKELADNLKRLVVGGERNNIGGLEPIVADFIHSKPQNVVAQHEVHSREDKGRHITERESYQEAVKRSQEGSIVTSSNIS